MVEQRERATEQYQNVLLFSVLAAAVYMVMVVLISYILAFPGFGVLILPQPFLEVMIGRWTMAYNPVSFSVIPWVVYTVTFHYIYYAGVVCYRNTAAVYRDIRVPVIGGILLFIVCLVLAMYTNKELWFRVANYITGDYALPFWTSAILANTGVEVVAHKASLEVLSRLKL